MIPSPAAAWALRKLPLERLNHHTAPHTYIHLGNQCDYQQDRTIPPAQRSTAGEERKLDTSSFSGWLCKCFPVARAGLADLGSRAGGVVADSTHARDHDHTTTRGGAIA